MKKTEYIDLIQSTTGTVKFLYDFDINDTIDPHFFVCYISSLCRIADNSVELMSKDAKMIEKDIEIYQHLQTLNVELEKLQPKLKYFVMDCRYYHLPHDVTDGLEYFNTFESEMANSFANLRRHDTFNTEERQVLLKDTEELCVDLHLKYREIIQRYATIAKETVDKINKLKSYLSEIKDEYADIIERSYFDFLEDNEYELEDTLYNLLYEKEYIDDYAKMPSCAHWSSLLKDKRTELILKPKVSIIHKVFSLQHPLDIRDERVIKYLYENCQLKEDLLLFFHCFAEIAILQCKTRPNNKMKRRVGPSGNILPLPSMVIPEISKDPELNMMFREAIKRLVPRTGKQGFKGKWSHVKKVLEDDGLISYETPTEFGRQMNEINPDVDAENCRKNIENNEILLNGNDKDKKYYYLPDTNTQKRIFDTISIEFEKLREKLIEKNIMQE